MRKVFIRVSLLVWACLSSASPAQAIDSPDYQRAESLIRQGQWNGGIQLLISLLQEPAAPVEKAKIHNLYGIALTGKGELAQADQQFEHALQTVPGFAPALKNLAVNEFNLKKKADAERHFRLALQLQPADPVIHAYLGEIAYDRREFRPAADHFLHAENLVLNDSTATVHLLESLFQSGQQAAALDVLGKLPPSELSLPLQFRIGMVLAKQRLFEQAIPHFQDATKLTGFYDAAFNLAICYLETRQYPQAIEVLRPLVDSEAKTAEALNLLAEAYEKNNQIKEAIDSLRQATLLAPDDEDNYADLASLCVNHEAYELGMEIIAVGLRHRPNSARLILERGLLQAMQNHFDLAENDFQLSSSLAPEKNLGYVGLGLSYMEEGKLPEALRILRQRIRRKPNDATLLYLLGEGLMRSGARPGEPAFTEAKITLSKSLRLNSTFPPAHVALAKLLLKQGNVEQAVVHLETARILDPKQKAAYSQLAIAYRREGKQQQAKDMLAILSRLNDEERLEDSRQHVRIVKTEIQDR